MINTNKYYTERKNEMSKPNKEELLNNFEWWKHREETMVNHLDDLQGIPYLDTINTVLENKPNLLSAFQRFCDFNFNKNDELETNVKWFLGMKTAQEKISNIVVDYQANRAFQDILNQYINFENHATWYTPNLIQNNKPRKQEYVSIMRSLYLDLDLNKSQIDIKQGIQRIFDVVLKNDIPFFDCLVYTGHGIQLYWYFKDSKNINDMMKLNFHLATLFDDLGVDYKVSQDSARYMRFPFTLNEKAEYDKPAISGLLYFNDRLQLKADSEFKKQFEHLKFDDITIANNHHEMLKPKIDVPVPNLPDKFSSTEEKQMYLNGLNKRLPEFCTIATSQEEGDLFSKYYLKHYQDSLKGYNAIDETSTTAPNVIAEGLKVSKYSLNSLFEILDIQKEFAKAYREGTAKTYRNNLLTDRLIILSKLPTFRPTFIDFAILGSGNQANIQEAIHNANENNYQKYQQLAQLIFDFNENELREVALPQSEVEAILAKRDLFYFAKFNQISRFKLMSNEGSDLPFYQEIIKKAQTKFEKGDCDDNVIDLISQMTNSNDCLQKVVEAQNQNVTDTKDTEIEISMVEDETTTEQPFAEKEKQQSNEIDEFNDLFMSDGDCFIADDADEVVNDNQQPTIEEPQIQSTDDELPKINEIDLQELKNNCIEILKNDNFTPNNDKLTQCFQANKDYLQKLLYIRSLILEYQELPLLEKIYQAKDDSRRQELLRLLGAKLEVKVIEEGIKDEEETI